MKMFKLLALLFLVNAFGCLSTYALDDDLEDSEIVIDEEDDMSVEDEE